MKKITFSFGRLNPPTIGHGKLLDALKKTARGEYRMYLSNSHDRKKNPLSVSDKVKYTRLMFPEHGLYIMNDSKIVNVFDILVKLYDEGYEEVTMVVGSDRVADFKKIMETYNGVEGKKHGFYDFKKITVKSAGERDPDATGVAGMSASKMRKAVLNNDFESFQMGLPSGFRKGQELFDILKTEMGVKQSFKEFIELNEGTTDATTFFHEVICGIACANPDNVKEIKSGLDIKKFFDNGTIVAIDASENHLDHDEESFTARKFFNVDSIPKDNIKTDALKIATILREKIGKPALPVLWTGPTNDNSDYGAADIAFNGIGVSLKYGKGQLKNLTPNTLFDALGISVLAKRNADKALNVLIRNNISHWDIMTAYWVNLISNSFSDPVVRFKFNEIVKKNNLEEWYKYQAYKMSKKDVEFFYNNVEGYESKKPKFRYLCKKIFELVYKTKSAKTPWNEQRNKCFKITFENYLTENEATIRKNLGNLFKVQMSVTKNALWYAADGGKEIHLLPTEVEANTGMKHLSFDYNVRYDTGGTKIILSIYNQYLAASAYETGGKIGAKDHPAAEIIITIRWKQGQMNGSPDTTSNKKLYVDNYVDLFGTYI